MNCPKCGSEITRNDIMEDGSICCPGCGAIYRRKATAKSESQQFDTQAGQHQRRKSKESELHDKTRAEKNKEDQITSSARIDVGTNGVAGFLKFCAYAIYIAALLLGLMAQGDSSAAVFKYIRLFSTISMVSIWINGFIYGTIALSVGEIIQLLHEINEKQS